MSGNKVFADTNILLYFLNGDKEVIDMLADKEIVISFISELELLAFPKISTDSEDTIKGLLKNCQVLDINSKIKELTIEFKRKSKLKLPDAIIAASAYFSKLPLITADKQFRTLTELDIIIYDL